MSKASKNTSHRKLYTVGSDAPFQFVEAYKSLRTNLEFLSSAGNCKTILITSSVPEEGQEQRSPQPGHDTDRLRQSCCSGGL